MTAEFEMISLTGGELEKITGGDEVIGNTLVLEEDRNIRHTTIDDYSLTGAGIYIG